MKTVMVSVFLFTVLFFSCGTARPHPDMIADVDPVSLGTIELELEKFLSSALEKKEATVVFVPRTDSVYLQFRFQTVTYRQYWDRSGRAMFKAALARYKDDYDARNLGLKPAKASRAYGQLKGYTEWGQLNVAVFLSGKAYPRMELGYRFNNGSPYLTVLQRRADDEGLAATESRESLNIRTYFTRAQATELVNLFEQDYLLSVLPAAALDKRIPVDSYNETPADAYTEIE
ncbi:MAG: hypothetical protein LBD71_00995 [Treponema sp.]|jgi:hypothetical protein|nr:hypothetical protein [Treponema sp.]